jgi:uncharacterized membrane protein
VRVFVRSTLTHVTLGIFLATFVVAVNALIATREGVSAGVPEYTLSALYLMVAATLAAFITFCHGIVRLLARALDGRAGADSPSPPAAIAPEEATP